MYATSLSPSSSDGTLPQQSSKAIDRISRAYQRGDFKLYEHFLGKSQGWEESHLEKLKKIANQNGPARENHLMSLFTLAIDPLSTNEEKMNEISTYLNQLEPDLKNGLLYQLTAEDPEFSLIVLKHCKKEIREEVYRNGLKHQRVKHYETFFFGIFKVMIHLSWAPLEKQDFLDEMFSILPPYSSDDLIYYFLKETSEKEQEVFLNCCSKELSKRIQNLRSEVIHYSLTVLKTIKTQPVRVHTDFKGNKNKFYLDFFYYQIKQDVDADLFAIELNQQDWEYISHKVEHDSHLNKHLPIFFASLVMKWMIKASQRLKENENFKDDGLWLFYHYASHFLDGKGCRGISETGWRGISEEDYVNLGKAQHPHYLPHLFNAFGLPAQQAIVKYCIQHEPQLLAWVDAILHDQKTWRDERTEKLNKIFDVISKSNLMQTALKILFSTEVHHSEHNKYKSEIELYCALDLKYQQLILRHFLQEGNIGLERLSTWISFIMISDKIKQEIFENNFYTSLKEIDPTSPLLLKSHLQKTLTSSPETELFIIQLLPIDCELLPLEEKQKRAILKLKQNFMTPNFPHEQRRKFVYNLREDLKLENEDSSALVEKLFKEIPPEAWPLIFLHFDSILSNSYYDAYYEEKSHGGMSKKQRREAPPLMEKSQREIPINEFAKNRLKEIANDPTNASFGDIFAWYSVILVTEPFLDGTLPQKKGFKDSHLLVDVCALTLLKMTKNPLLKDQSGDSQAVWAMQHLYQVACEKNALHLIIQRFMEIAPIEKFIPTMEKFSQSCFHYNRDGLKQILAECFEEIKIDKFEYISKCLVAHHKSGDKYSEIANSLLKKPIAADEVETATIGKALLKLTGVQYLSYYFSSSSFTYAITKALKATDPTYCEIFFWDFLTVLTQVTNQPKEKLCMFQNMMSDYESAGYDILALLSEESAKSLIPIIKTWYESEDLSQIDTSLSGLTLLRYFNPLAFYPIVLNEVKKNCAKERTSFFSLDNLFHTLSKMKCRNELISKLSETDPEVFLLIKNTIRKDLVECLEYSYTDLGPLALEWIPDWKERLIEWVKENIKKDKQEAIENGNDNPSYYDVVRLYKSLARIGVLETWLLELSQACPSEMHKDLQKILVKYSKK